MKSSIKAKPGKNASGGATAPEYEVVNNATVWIVRDKKGRPRDVPLANFHARIVRAVEVDDGAETRHFFDIRQGKRSVNGRGRYREASYSVHSLAGR